MPHHAGGRKRARKIWRSQLRHWTGEQRPRKAGRPHCGAIIFVPVYRMTDTILLTNMDSVPGRTIVQHIGLAQGNVVRAKHVGRDIAASLKNIVGGELRGYTELLEEARRDAIARMTEDARAQGANAVVNIRLSTSSVTSGASELYAYGTAVVVE